MNWAKELRNLEESNEGKLCKTGEIEVAGIAKRLRERLDMDRMRKGKFIVENTFKTRTQQTRDIFMKNLIPENFPKDEIYQQEANRCEDIIGSDGAVNRTVFDRYAPLRFFSVCPVGSPFPRFLELQAAQEGAVAARRDGSAACEGLRAGNHARPQLRFHVSPLGLQRAGGAVALRAVRPSVPDVSVRGGFGAAVRCRRRVTMCITAPARCCSASRPSSTI